MRFRDLMASSGDEFVGEVFDGTGGVSLHRYFDPDRIRPLGDLDSAAPPRALALRIDSRSDPASMAPSQDILQALTAGDRLVLLFRAPVIDVDIPSLLGLLDQIQASVCNFAPLDYEQVRCGVVAEVQGQPKVPLVGGRWAVLPEEMRGFANQHVLELVAARALRHHWLKVASEMSALRTLPVEVERLHRRTVEQEKRSALHAEELESALAKSADRLDHSRREVLDTTRRLDQFMASTSYQLGSAITDAGRSPRDLLRAPRRVGRALKVRGAWRDRSPTADLSPTARGADDSDELDGLFIAHRSFPDPSQQCYVTGAISRHTSSLMIDPSLAVRPLPPHGARHALDRADPALFLIESRATELGEAWVTLGHPEGDRLESLMSDCIREMSRRGVPTAFLWNSGRWRAPGLDRLATMCDVVLAEPGVVPSDMGVPFSLSSDLGQVRELTNSDALFAVKAAVRSVDDQRFARLLENLAEQQAVDRLAEAHDPDDDWYGARVESRLVGPELVAAVCASRLALIDLHPAESSEACPPYIAVAALAGAAVVADVAGSSPLSDTVCASLDQVQDAAGTLSVEEVRKYRPGADIRRRVACSMLSKWGAGAQLERLLSTLGKESVPLLRSRSVDVQIVGQLDPSSVPDVINLLRAPGGLPRRLILDRSASLPSELFDAAEAESVVIVSPRRADADFRVELRPGALSELDLLDVVVSAVVSDAGELTDSDGRRVLISIGRGTRTGVELAQALKWNERVKDEPSNDT